MKASVYIATSLDGFIARRNGSIDWLNDAHALVPEGEDCGFGAFMDSVDALIMGRKTYEQVLSFGQWPYGETPVVVLSHRPPGGPSHLPNTVSYSSETPKALLKRLSGLGMKHVYVDGGNTIQGFLVEALIDEITITTIPVAIGDGIPLFNPTGEDVKLTHLRTTAYDFGFVQTTYRVDKSA
ncbi:MAG: dihydrofolate reductase [Lentisphaerae bacterium]|jgi:dihydrofolate reductase|nr:dihydrofolate reductase [Lentisphaerota bacterium]MBT4818958.1 dihydrofolate reductase [Lentisphaerota bacterium]MBT5605305.1 dihydrofolate reductase [Lentisphaerota bacterium]MBT7057545.1 dihydrofolate reductase [Lentisphaerota bacterium]MBT7840689.1 dihydrofolate reductase [Lentisphaerota bacterium]